MRVFEAAFSGPNRAMQGERRECERCRGTGRALPAVIAGEPAHGAGEYRAVCPRCGGTGRRRLLTK